MNAPTGKIEAADSLLSALAIALPSLEGAKKNSANPHFKSKYADLGAVIDAIRPIAEHGIWWRQVDLEREGGAAVETFYIGHGEEISAGVTFVPADRTNAQGYGSAKTYARRYGLQNAFGLSSEDDDGNAAAAAPPKRKAVSDSDWDDIVADILAKCDAVTKATGENQVSAICGAYSVGAITDLTPAQTEAVLSRLKEKLEGAGEKVDV